MVERSGLRAGSHRRARRARLGSLLLLFVMSAWPALSHATAPQSPGTPALVPLTTRPPLRRVMTVVLAPAWLSVGFVRFDAEFRLAQRLGLKAAMATFGDFGFRDNVFGAQLNYYLFGRFERGWQVGLEYVAGQKHGSELFAGPGAGDVAGGAPLLRIALAGPHVGYKYVASSGLSIELQLGLHGAWTREFRDGAQVNSNFRALPVIATNFGWSI